MIKAVFFDVGGVLITAGGTKSRIAAARVLGVSLSELSPSWELLIEKVAEGRISEREFWRKIAATHLLPRNKLHLLVRIFSLRRPRLKRRVKVIAEKLAANGYTVGILSDVVPTHAKLLQRIGTYDGFRPVLLSCRIGAIKMKPRAFRIAARSAGVKFAEMAFFDDHEANVAVARRLGIKAFVYKNPTQLVCQLRRYGVKI